MCVCEREREIEVRKSSEYLYNFYFKFFIRHIIYISISYLTTLCFLWGRISVCSFCVTICFHVLGKSAVSPVFDGSDTRKMRACSALKSQCPLFTGTFHFRYVCYVSSMCPTVLAELPFSQVQLSAIFACYGQGLVLVVLVASPGITWLELSQASYLLELQPH